MSDPLAGRVLLHYEILEKLGEGGMGVVYKARDTHLDRFVAIKVLPPEKVADPDRKRRFVQEAKAASALNHPNIIVIHDIASSAGSDFMVMEYVAGRTLDHAIQRKGMRLVEVLKYAVQIADALATAHEAGIIHRDLRPGNIMITDKGVVKVLDFGLAKLTETVEADEAATLTIQREQQPLTEHGAVLGTVSYMSPEQAEGRKVDARSDIFAFGSLLYEMVTGRRAFHGDSKMSTITAILRDDPKAPSEIGEFLPRDLEKIITRCLRKDPARRFQHMADVKVALEELKEESDSGRLATTPVAPAPPRSRLLYAAMALAVVASVAAGVLWWRSGTRPGAVALTLRQLTQDTGVTIQPSISPDGKLVAYASDRAGDGGLDIWVQQLSRGAQPIRLTRHKADDVNPSFSPDGGQVTFASARDGGGIYVMPSLGGQERLLLRGQYFRPRFSPDGQWIACAEAGGSEYRMFVLPVSGGPPRRIAANFYRAQGPVWSPDGKKILFVGFQEPGQQEEWWVAPIDGGPVVATGAAGALPGSFYTAGEWLEDQVLFSSDNLWRVPISPTSFRVGKPERLTSGSAIETGPRAIPGSRPGAVFTSGQRRGDLWSLPIESNTGRVLSEPVQLIRSAFTPSMSGDGSRLSYFGRELENFALRVRDLKGGSETTLLQFPEPSRARLSPDGSTVAYNPRHIEGQPAIFLISASGGDSRKVCDNCGLVYDWSRDGTKIVYRSGKPIRFSMIEVATSRRTEIVAHPKHGILGAMYSPDSRWLALHLRPQRRAASYLPGARPRRKGRARERVDRHHGPPGKPHPSLVVSGRQRPLFRVDGRRGTTPLGPAA